MTILILFKMSLLLYCLDFNQTRNQSIGATSSATHYSSAATKASHSWATCKISFKITFVSLLIFILFVAIILMMLRWYANSHRQRHL